MAEPATRAWPAALSLAQKRAADGRIESADSLLATFAVRYPGTSEADESLFWRAVLELDPTNHVATNTGALSLLDAYLSKAPGGEHRTEAVTLRRLSGHLESLTKLAASAMSNAQDANAAAANANARVAEAKTEAKPPDTSSQDAEIKRLRDELAKANAELERIRRRLAQPPLK
ncbi:MAG TPA: hypothetical protein VF159_07945 [Gemmatimonadaceae bacterium]